MNLFIKIHDFVYKSSSGYNNFIERLSDIVNQESDKFSDKINILDLPCITGNLCKKIKARENFYYFSSDIELKNILVTKIKNSEKNIEFIVLDAESPLPFQPESFDLIVINNLIYYIKKKDNFLNECNTVLKPNGTLIVSNINLEKSGLDILTKFGFKYFFDYLVWALPNYFFSFGKNLFKDKLEDIFSQSKFRIHKKESVFYDKINLYVLKKI